MITYNECKELVGEMPPIPEAQFVWYAYTQGTVTECKSQDEAKRISKIFEKVQTNGVEYNKAWDERRNHEQKVTDLWHKHLREEFSYYSDELFDLMYSEAYDRYHSSGYDEIANGMIDISDFVDKIIAVLASK